MNMQFDTAHRCFLCIGVNSSAVVMTAWSDTWQGPSAKHIAVMLTFSTGSVSTSDHNYIYNLERSCAGMLGQFQCHSTDHHHCTGFQSRPGTGTAQHSQPSHIHERDQVHHTPNSIEFGQNQVRVPASTTKYTSNTGGMTQGWVGGTTPMPGKRCTRRTRGHGAERRHHPDPPWPTGRVTPGPPYTDPPQLQGSPHLHSENWVHGLSAWGWSRHPHASF